MKTWGTEAIALAKCEPSPPATSEHTQTVAGQLAAACREMAHGFEFMSKDANVTREDWETCLEAMRELLACATEASKHAKG